VVMNNRKSINNQHLLVLLLEDEQLVVVAEVAVVIQEEVVVFLGMDKYQVLLEFLNHKLEPVEAQELAEEVVLVQDVQLPHNNNNSNLMMMNLHNQHQQLVVLHKVVSILWLV